MQQVEPGVVEVNRRLPVSPQAGEHLAALVRASNAAQEALRAYMAGLADGLGLAQDDILGFDDATCELVLAEADPARMPKAE